MIDVEAGLERIFRAHRDDIEGRVTTLEAAVAALATGSLGDALRAAAERDAHTLAGSLGTFGLPCGSQLALELEQGLAPGRRPVGADRTQLTACVVALRAEVDGEYARLESGETSSHTGPVDVRRERDAIELEATERQEFRDGILASGLAGEQPDGGGQILVVDDDPAVRDLLVGMLADVGYDVRGVGSAQEARHALEHETIALLLSDVSMPGETGLDLIRFALCEHPETATLLISALDDPGIARVAMDYGAYGYLTKPIRRSPVLIGVMNALRRRDIEGRERSARLNLKDHLGERTRALTDALERLEGAAAEGRRLQATTIHRWAESAEYRNPGIGQHLKRVGHYCAMLGQKFGLSAESLGLASALHDVGKVAISDTILLKPGPLTEDERLTMQTHARVGYEMLRDSRSGLLDLAAVIAHTHHEKFDGSGYPCGLTGKGIPLEGRIAAVADVFDALTSDRVYRPGWSVDTTIAWMQGERGRHFDPDVLDAFLSSMEEVRSVQSLLSDWRP
ncbi:MAG: cyclic di-GMP phosphodiesterase [Solirubrobacteraceae bacterium]|jgi:putative two-component system response regulator|nr:cyclic di-GMP phosphodiesterase [Solirubrobacteraceae bacterium]